MRLTRALAAWLGLLVAGVPTFARAAGEPEREAGRALAQELRSQRPTENSQFNGFLEIRNRDHPATRVPVELRVKVETPDWESVYEAFSADHAITERLTVRHAEGKPTEYWVQRAAHPGAPLGAPASIPARAAAVPFAGSDFWLTDLGLEFIEWPDQRLVKQEMRRGRACKVLESLNPQPADGNYARVWSWVDAENGGLVRAEAYDKQNRLWKEFAVDRLKKVHGHWELKEVEIRNVQAGTRTHLVYDTDTPPARKPAP